MKSPFRHIKHAHKTFDHFHENLHHAFVVIVAAIVGMLRGASQLLTPSVSTANRQWGGFITNDFWEQSQNNDNIKYALFGNGAPGSTAYTRLWNTSCVPSNVVYLNSLNGGSLAANTIYVIESGSYNLISSLVMNSCSVLIGRGDVTITSTNTGANPLLSISSKNNIIIDNIRFNGNTIIDIGVSLSSSSNISANNIISYNNIFAGYNISQSHYTQISNSQLFNNSYGILFFDNTKFSLNNSLIYNNTVGILNLFLGNIGINNTQIFNNTSGVYLTNNTGSSINNSIFYNNNEGIRLQGGDYISNNISSYNNTIGLTITSNTFGFVTTIGNLTGYGNTNIFNNNTNTTIISGNNFSLGSIPPAGLPRSAGLLNTGSITLDYNRFTNPQNSNGQSLLSGTNFSILRGIQLFTATQPIRYIFGINILQQKRPVRNNGSSYGEYGTNSADYFTTKYISEPESSLPLEQQEIVEQYFGSESTYTENRETNGCSLSAFQIVELDPNTFGSSYNFEDHTLYILTGGEYKSTVSAGNAFILNGNCIALIGNENTRFTKAGGGISSVLYAQNKRNIIIDGIKVDGTYYGVASAGGTSFVGIKLDGTTNNTTLNNIQVYNNADYGIYLGLGSSYITLMNIQAFNNIEAGIYLSYTSNYNIINNTQTYNNGGYGIWFANGSSRNTINNFQSYNNAIGIFGDLTTKENTINKAAIYNNSTAGIYFKNSSGNMMNDTRIYNNQRGVKALYNSPNNQYHGKFELYNNLSGNFDGTNANDGTLFSGAGLFAYPGTLYTGNSLLGCTYATNPSITTTSATLLMSMCNNIGFSAGFVSPYNATIQYTFGLNMHKQSIPVRYTTIGGLLEIPSQYNASKYIAETFAIRNETPENVSFVSTGNIELNTRYTSEVYTAATINTTINAALTLLPSTATGYLIISGQNVGLTGTVNNGNTLQITVRSATGYNQTITGTITLGTVSTGFTVTTKNYNELPTTGSLAFSTFTSLEVNILTGSTTTVAGLETGVYASIHFEPSATLGRLAIYSGGTLIASGTTGLLVYNGNQIQTRTQSSSGYGNTVTGNVTIGLGTGRFTLTTKGGDIVAPSTPSIIYPLSGEYMFFVAFDWNASIDTGSGIEGYMYEIASDSSFMDITHTGFIATQTGTTGSPDTDFTTKSGRHYFKIKARDRDGNYSSRSNTGSFRVLSLVDRTLADITGANLISYYTSDILQVKGISSGISLRASVSSNALLYKNGEERGTGAYVQNNDLLYLKIRSSNNYNTIKTGTMTLANRLVDFSVRTKPSAIYGCTLTDDDRDNIEAIFDSMVDNYINNPEHYEEFLYTMQSMLEDEINFSNNCNLSYLQNLVKQALGLTQIIVSTGSHIAPNCKEYLISYDMDTYIYTSPTLVRPIYFANRDTLTRYIDSRNAGDCHINTYGASSRYFTNNDPNKHIAPNGKIYSITIESGKYTSNNFITQKYFSSLSELRNYIDKNNMPSNVWNHQVDTTFTPQIYTAPNAKEYKIYRTNRGYMSYKLLKVQYFGSLSEIQSYISRNNPR